MSNNWIVRLVPDADEGLREKELVRTLQSEQQRVQQEIAKVYRLYQEEQVDSEAFGKFYRPLEERGKQIAEELPRVQSGIDISKVRKWQQQPVISTVNGRNWMLSASARSSSR